MLIARLVVSFLFVGLIAFFVLRSSARKKALGSVQPGLDALQAAFAQSRTPDETEPVCVVAFHYSFMKAVQVTVGVTNQRVLVVKGTGPLHSFAYDYAGEHLPSAQKSSEKRGFFHWTHGQNGYSPRVQQPSVFRGEEWLMAPVIQGFPEQQANLRQFADRFYFKWFYG